MYEIIRVYIYIPFPSDINQERLVNEAELETITSSIIFAYFRADR